MMFNKKAYHPLKRAMALLLVLVLISTTMVFPIDPASAVAETPDPAAIDIAATAGTAITDGFITSYNMIADPDTSNTQFGSVGLATPTPVWNNTTAQDGRLWADKSVNVYSASIYDVSGLPVSTITAAPDEFLVTLSAQSQAFQVDTTILTPSDTVFVIDVSGSMAVNEVGTSGLTRVAVLVQALNSAIEQLMTANPNNRIAVVAFGGHVVSNANATEIINVLPLASYTQVTNGQFFTLTNSTTITVSSQITNPGSRTIPVGGGTPPQRGIYAGAQILLSANTTYSTTVGGVPYDLTRTPNIVLLTDGEPTFGWVDYAFNTAPTDTNFTVGNGTAADMGLSLLTVLTASAMRQLVHDHYFGPTDMTSSVGFFNIGIGDTSIYTDGALNPYGSTGNAANPSQVNADMVSQTFSGVTYNMRTLLDSFAAGNAITLPILNRNSSTVYALQTLTNSVMVNGVATPGYIRTCNYATFAITGVNNAQEIVDIFSNVADTIISQGSYITRAGGDPDFTGYVIFSDIVGQYMQFRTGYGLWVNNVLNDGSAFAAELATSPTLQQTLAQSIVDSQTSVVVGVQNPINITQALSLVQSSIAAGAGNAVVYYTDNNRQWLQNYYSSTGAVLSPPAGAYAITRRYTSQGSIENVVTGEMTDIMNVAFYVITVITPGQFTGVYSSPTDLVRELGVGDQIVRLYIPASLIPMRSVTEDATTGQIQVVEAVPLRFIYSVGIDVDRTLTYLPTDTTYIAANGVPGDYVYLYTNRWQEYANLALVYFQPNVANPYYPVGAPPDNAPAEVANITQTNPYIWEDFAFLDTNGDQVFVKYFGNNGRLELPFTNAQVIKEWDPRLNNLEGQGAPGGLIAPEYVQLYDSEGLPVGAPVLLTPDWSSVTDPTTEGPYATYTWTNIPLYDLLPDASGNAVPMTFSVLEGDMQGAVFVPYTTAGGTNDPGFDIVYMQPVWDAGTNTWQLTIANTYRVEGQWFVLLSKEFEGLPPSAIP
ncbi:MAG: VWA domain-containing protein, partial [Defluviitaleaceae bacterium]|nr:VWA domain-containing protein [Defluviitaleaceae bacterium]